MMRNTLSEVVMSKHPGQVLYEDFMVPLNLTANQVAKGLGVNRSTVGRLLHGKVRMTSVMAACLGAYFQVPGKWWLLMQCEYDTEQLAHTGGLERVSPLVLDPDVLLTPKGVLHLGPAGDCPGDTTLSMSELEALPQTSKPATREVRTVRYENGSIAMVGDYEQD